jgi:hypothetical protein
MFVGSRMRPVFPNSAAEDASPKRRRHVEGRGESPFVRATERKNRSRSSMSSANPARAERFGGLKVACVAAAVVVAAAWAPLLPESTSAEGRKIRGLDVAAVFPSTTTALIEFDGRPWHAHGAELWTSRVLKTPEMQEFLGRSRKPTRRST